MDYTDLVCGMNLELLNGLGSGIGPTDLEPLLEPTPGQSRFGYGGRAAAVARIRRWTCDDEQPAAKV